MKLSSRLALIFGLLGVVIIATIAGLSWFLAAGEIRGSVDDDLLDEASVMDSVLSGQQEIPQEVREMIASPEMRELLGSDESGFQAFGDQNQALTPGPFAADPGAVQRIADGADRFFLNAEEDGESYRLYVIAPDSVDDGRGRLDGVAALVLYRRNTVQEATLSNLAVQLLIGSLAGVVLVFGAGWFIGRRLGQPLVTLTEGAERLAALEDLPGRIEISRGDEIGQLAGSFNRVLAALEVGREQQQRLVMDASHELRTPLTALMMRIEFLSAHADLDATKRTQMLAEAQQDVEQLAALVSEIVDLAATVQEGEEGQVATRLGDIVEDVAGRRRASSGRSIVVDADDHVAVVRPTMIRRAVQNLLDNAIKYSPDSGEITIISRDGRIEVRDQGPGIAPEDADHVFDRFFRAPKARSRPGNGIGLAIVKQVADAHGGDVWARNNPDGGAAVGFEVTPEPALS